MTSEAGASLFDTGQKKLTSALISHGHDPYVEARVFELFSRILVDSEIRLENAECGSRYFSCADQISLFSKIFCNSNMCGRGLNKIICFK